MKSVIFDFNGTMIFDEKLQEESWRLFIKRKLNRYITDEEFQQYIHGINVDVTLKYFFRRDFTRQEAEVLEEEKEKIYRDLCLKSPDYKLADGLETFLNILSEKHIPINIATAAGRRTVQFFFDTLNLHRWFNFEKAALNDGTVPGKPEPDIYLKACANIGADIKSAIVFEDSPAGLEAARRAGAGLIIRIASMKQFGRNDIAAATLKDFSNTKELLELAGLDA